MAQLNWWQAFSVVDERIKASQDAELQDAWQRFLMSPFPHLSHTADAERFMATASQYDGRGTELLLHRLVQAIKSLQATWLDAQPGHAAAAANGAAQPAMPDELYQPDYCEVCGHELDAAGRCWHEQCSQAAAGGG